MYMKMKYKKVLSCVLVILMISAYIPIHFMTAVSADTPAYDDFLWPVPGYFTVSSPFGYRTNPITGQQSLHAGIDITGNNILGKNVVASESGVVLEITTTNDGAYGRSILIDNGNGFETFYGHCNSTKISVGQPVNRGDVIATVGATGWTTGPDLFFQIELNDTPVNPETYFSIKTTSATCVSFVDSTGTLYMLKGHDLDSIGLYANFDNGMSYEVFLNSSMISGYDKNCLGNQVVTITYQGITTIINVDVVAPITSNTYNIDTTEGYIKGITPDTLVLALKDNIINPSEQIEVLSNSSVENEDNNVGTGMQVLLTINNQYLQNLTKVINGDVNGDGKVDLSDLVMIRNYISGGQSITGAFNTAGNLYNEGDITLNDLVGMMAYISGSGNLS